MELTLDQWMRDAYTAMIKTHYHERGLQDAVDKLSDAECESLTGKIIDLLCEAEDMYGHMGRDKIVQSLVRLTQEALHLYRVA